MVIAVLLVQPSVTGSLGDVAEEALQDQLFIFANNEAHKMNDKKEKWCDSSKAGFEQRDKITTAPPPDFKGKASNQSK